MVKIKKRTKTELKEIAEGIHKGTILSSLKLYELGHLSLIPHVFRAFGEFIEDHTVDDLMNIGMIYEYIDKAIENEAIGGLKISGVEKDEDINVGEFLSKGPCLVRYPIFDSYNLLNDNDSKEIITNLLTLKAKEVKGNNKRNKDYYL